MSGVFQGRSICAGMAEGEALVTKQGISFWGGVDSDTGVITEVGHELYGQEMAGKVLVLPALKGSAGGMWIMIRLAMNKRGPQAIIVPRGDTILVGAVIMGEIPTIDSLPDDVFEMIRSGDRLKVDGTKGTMEVLDRGRKS
jgi:hypothetical protein